MDPHACIIVFAKAPDPGTVKTRLIPALGAQGAATLHEKLVRHTLATVTQPNLCAVELWCAPSPSLVWPHPFFARCQNDFPVGLRQQCGDDLGARMHHALDTALQKYSYAIVIGTDCPALTASYLQEALDNLRQGKNAVLGPAQDGGYVLMGVRQSHPRLFSGVAWGTASVLNETRARLAALNWQWQELAEQWDIDRPEDLSRLEIFFAESPENGNRDQIPPAKT
jgi:rSAM/selenodomain-associated transferase 1